MSTEVISQAERVILLKAIFSGEAEVSVATDNHQIQVKASDPFGKRCISLWLDCCTRQGLKIEANTVKMIAVWLLNCDEFHQLATQAVNDTSWLSLDTTDRLIYRTPPQTARAPHRVVTI